MSNLVRLLGDAPRVRLLEALLRFGGMQFTRGELAREAGLYRMTTNREVPRLLRDGLIEQVSGGPRPKYRAPAKSPTLDVLDVLDAALGLMDRQEQARSAQEIDEVVDEYRKTMRRILGFGPDRERRAGRARPAKALRKRDT